MKIRRFSPWAVFGILVFLILLAGWILGIDPGYFWERRDHLGDIITHLIPPDWGYAAKVVSPLLATIQMSVTGTILGSFFAILVAPLCAGSCAFPAWIRGILKFLIQVTRSFPALILALMATFLFGLGTFAGTAALTLYTFAIMVRLTYEDIESQPRRVFTALRVLGCGRMRAFLRGILPEIASTYLTNVLYMLESNVRQSAILGYVGAGGIGILLNEKMSWREYGKAGMILLFLLLTVCLIEWISQYLSEIVRQERRVGKGIRRMILVLGGILFLFCTVTIKAPDFSHTTWTVLSNMFLGFVHPDFSFMADFTKAGLLWLLLETVLIAFLGTLLGAILSFPLALLNTSRLMPLPVSLFFRFVVLLIRSVPFLIYGLIFVRVTGQGAFTGVLTVGICSVGLITKRFTQAVDALDFRAWRSLRVMGTPLFHSIRYGLLPQLWPAFASAVLYRFDVNIREASILGLVGAGGIGAPLIFAMNHYDWRTAGAISIGLILLVWLIDVFSVGLRRRLSGSGQSAGRP